jgi:hypothetical protein
MSAPQRCKCRRRHESESGVAELPHVLQGHTRQRAYILARSRCACIRGLQATHLQLRDFVRKLLASGTADTRGRPENLLVCACVHYGEACLGRLRRWHDAPKGYSTTSSLRSYIGTKLQDQAAGMRDAARSGACHDMTFLEGGRKTATCRDRGDSEHDQTPARRFPRPDGPWRKEIAVRQPHVRRRGRIRETASCNCPWFGSIHVSSHSPAHAPISCNEATSRTHCA